MSFWVVVDLNLGCGDGTFVLGMPALDHELFLMLINPQSHIWWYTYLYVEALQHKMALGTCYKSDLLALFCVIFSYVFFAFPYGILGQVWYLIVWFLIFAFSFTLVEVKAGDGVNILVSK